MTKIRQHVWEATFDSEYDIRVERTGDYKGNLIIEHKGKVLAMGDVTLSYAAQFGPDVGDVSDWQNWSTNFIDQNGEDIGPLQAMQ